MKITPAIVKKVAQLAKLELSPPELETFTSQLDAILTYMEQLDELDTKAIQGTAHVLEMNCPDRQDELQPAINPREIVQGAPQQDEGYFIVPKIIE